MLVQVQFLLSPQLSKQLLWSRSVNTHGLPGKNVVCDLHIHGSLAKCLLTVSELINYFDQEHKVKEEADRHSLVRSSKDRDLY